MISFVPSYLKMARKKKYNEKDVLEKALTLFWSNGYETTSTRMLEKQMGINQFSIYASFGNKEGLYMECLKLYKQKIKVITNKLESSNEPVEAIKNYFYDFIEFSKIEGFPKGCFVTNTANEFGLNDDCKVSKEAINFTEHVRNLFLTNLKLDTNKNIEHLEKQADYLIISIASLSVVSKIFPYRQIETYVENTFLNI